MPAQRPQIDAEGKLATNEIGRVALRIGADVPFDLYEDNRATGAFVVLDPATNATYPPDAYTKGAFRWKVFDSGGSVS